MRAYPSTPLCRKVETGEHAGMLLTSLTFPVGGNIQCETDWQLPP